MCWTAVHWKHRHHKFLRWHLDSWTYTGVFNVANLLFNAKHLNCSVNSDQRCSWNSCISAFYLQWSILLQMRFIMLNISSVLWTVDTLSLYWSLLRRMRRFSWDLTYSLAVQLCAFFPMWNSEKQQWTVDFTLLQKPSAWNATKISPAWLLPAPEGLLFCFLPLPCNRKLLLTILDQKTCILAGPGLRDCIGYPEAGNDWKPIVFLSSESDLFM